MRSACVSSFVLTIICWGSVLGDEGPVIETNASLGKRPFHQQPPAAALRAKAVRVIGEFIEQEKLLRITRGQMVEHMYLVTYRILSSDEELPIKLLVFTVMDSTPDARSRMRARRMVWPFQKGGRVFYVKRDESCRFRPYFDILAHHRLEKAEESKRTPPDKASGPPSTK